MKIEPITIWFTGLPASGKSTLSVNIRDRLIVESIHCFVLDGDQVRTGLNSDLGYSAADRAENIRRVAEVSKLFNTAGLVVIAALISPYRKDRKIAREIIGTDRFVEIYLSADLVTCETRDTKGHYLKARQGLLENFTGVSALYEPPLDPDLEINTGVESVELSINKITNFIFGRYSS